MFIINCGIFDINYLLFYFSFILLLLLLWLLLVICKLEFILNLEQEISDHNDYLCDDLELLLLLFLLLFYKSAYMIGSIVKNGL